MDSSVDTLFDTGGEMGRLMRTMDWTRSSVGAPDQWPQSLRTAVSICLASRFPMLIWWGPRMAMLYNDAYRLVIGDNKHPAAMGQDGAECWPEIWDIIGPMLQGVLDEGLSTWSEDQLLLLNRNGYAEECYFTFSYSPIRAESGNVAGIFTAVAETTSDVLSRRRLGTLRDLAANCRTARTQNDVLSAAKDTLHENENDLPDFTLVQLHPEGGLVEACSRLGTNLTEIHDLSTRLADGSLVEFGDRGDGRPTHVATLAGSLDRGSLALLVGLSDRLPYDESYRSFVSLTAGEIAAALVAAGAHESERRQADALLELDRAKTTFFTNVSHEFRTPLTLMLGPLEELEKEPLSDPQHEGVALARRNAQRLLRLVNSLLDFSRLEAGRIKVDPKDTDLPRYTADLVSMFRAATERAGITLRVDCPATPARVLVDPEVWEKIVLNLLSNAFKFTLAGEISVSLKVADGAARLSVRDTGIGIEAEHLPGLFTRFTRIEGARGRSVEGSGIGLALVHELVELQNGSIQVESCPGKGTEFVVTVPAMEAAAETNGSSPVDRPPGPSSSQFLDEALGLLTQIRHPSGAAASIPSGNEGTVLVVDDNSDMRSYLADLLSSRWRVVTAANAGEALALTERDAPDLVLTDVMMPGDDGFALIRSLRSRAATSDVPVIVVSARAGEEAKAEGLERGADDYITKPFAARELLASVASHVEAGRSRRAAARERGHLYSLFEQAPVPIAVLRGPDLVFELANQRYLDVTGDRPLVGKPLTQALPELAGQGWDDVLRNVLRSGEAYEHAEASVRLARRGGHEVDDVYFTFIYAPLRESDGSVNRVTVFANDVTDQVRARRQLESVVSVKDEFLSLVSHELRTPLTTLRGTANILRRRIDDLATADRQDALADLERGADQLNRLVDNMLTLAQVENGFEAALEPQLLNHLIASEVQQHRREFAEWQVEVSAPSESLLVLANADSVRQIMTNLLSNARKYGSSGTAITVRLEALDGSALVSVGSRGEDVSDEDLERIFEPFFRTREARGRAPGIGLGLTVCKRLADMQGGSMAVIRRSGVGIEFALSLPLFSVPEPCADSTALLPGGRSTNP